jgi:hypothetical protein
VKKRTLLTRAQPGGEASPPRLTARQMSQRIVGELDRIIRLECAGNDSFPPLQLIPNIDGQIQVSVIFDASPSRVLPQRLSICFDCELVDEATMALSIVASACLLPTGVSHGNPPAPANVFRGPVDSNSLPAQIQDVLWCAIDLAQRQAAPSTSGGDARWLNLVQELEGQP